MTAATILNAQGRRAIAWLTNKSGGSVAKGDVVVLDATNDEAFTTTTSAAAVKVVGVVVEENGIANNSTGRVALSGYVSLINVNASVTRGDYGGTHTVAKQAASLGSSRATGSFCQFTTGGTTPSAILFGITDGSATGTSFAAPGLTFGTSNSAGVASTAMRTDATIALFDATAPVTQAFGDSAAAGSAGVAARRDHTHGMPAALSFHGCKVYYSTTQAISNGVTAGLIYDSEEYDTDAFHFTSAANLTGTVAKTSGSANIVGTGTSFTTELSVNQVISIPGTATEIGVVKTITDNTHIVLWQTMANTASGQTATRKNDYTAIPSGLTGKYSLKAGGFWSTAPATGFMGFMVNGAVIRGHRSNSSANYMQVTTDALLSAGDYIQVVVNESNGNYNFGHASAVDAQSFFALAYLGA